MTATGRPPPLLLVDGLEVWYGAAIALAGVSIEVGEGEVVVMIGGNGAGKSTTLRTISGLPELTKRTRGRISFAGEPIDRWPAHRIAAAGISHVPEGRHVFAASTVEENLVLGGYRRRRDRAGIRSDIDRVYDRFAVLAQRRDQPAGLLSGGEQQMLAIGRGLMARPRFLLLDEPSLGLAPILVAEMFEIVRALAAEGTTILLVEQMARQALAVADHAYVIDTGVIVADGPAADIAGDPAVQEAYLGAGPAAPPA